MKMITNINFLKYATLAASASLLFSSCDSSDPANDTSDFDINLAERGIDFDYAVANPADIAELPVFLLSTDVITHGNIPILDTRNVSQLDQGIINTAGEMKVDNITLTWDRSSSNKSRAFFSLSSANEFPLSDVDKVSYFEGLMDTVISTAAGSNDSVNQALNNNIDSSTPTVLANAGAAIGLLTTTGPESWFSNSVDIPLVLMERDVIYTVTSTNQDLIDNGTISGTYSFTDRWGAFSLQSEGALEDEAVFDAITLAHSDAPFFLFSYYNDAFGLPYVGTFTITIGQ